LEPGGISSTSSRACFPAGTVSGAPKIRAMEIIDELEPTPRPLCRGGRLFRLFRQYGFLHHHPHLSHQGQDLWIQAGAGIVADSDPQKEYEETINKSMGLRRAVELAEKGF
jgi:anthranilate synthase component I